MLVLLGNLAVNLGKKKGKEVFLKLFCFAIHLLTLFPSSSPHIQSIMLSALISKGSFQTTLNNRRKFWSPFTETDQVLGNA